MTTHRLVGVLCAATLVGCSSQPDAKPLSGDSFYRGTVADRRQQAADRGGAIVPSGEPAPKQPGLEGVTDMAPTPGISTPAADASPDTISPTVTKNVGPATAVALPATQPTTRKPPRVIPQYMTIGGVVAEVNGTPIYADAVLRGVAPLLAARAKDLDADRFKITAEGEVNRQVDELIRSEAEYAAASRNTVGADKDIAERLTAIDRQKAITEASGSIELARSRAREQGLDFDEQMKQQYRLNLVRVYYQKKVFPRVQVSAQDMRRFYDQNRDLLFSERDSAKFRVLSVSVRAAGNEAAAVEQINALHARAVSGEDFGELIKTLKNPPASPTPAPIERNAYKYSEVEQAIWELEPGQVTQPIKSGDAYFVAKLEEKKLGTTQGFNDAAVQASITEKLRSEQFNKLRNQVQETMRRDSTITRNAQMVAATVDMAVQNYDRWRE